MGTLTVGPSVVKHFSPMDESGARCIRCKKEVDMATLMEHIEREEVMKCPHCR